MARCPECNGLIVFDREKVEYVCAVCDSVVQVMEWPYPEEFMEAVYMTRVAPKAARAKELIKKHIQDVEGVAVSLSGKDSLVALDITMSAGVVADVVIATYVATRRLPWKVVEELKSAAESLGARSIIIHDKPWNIHTSLFRIIRHTYGYGVIITGLRRRENPEHRGFVEYHEWFTPQRWILINPIINWTTEEVWSYIYHRRLPLPTPYRLAPPDASLQHILFD